MPQKLITATAELRNAARAAEQKTAAAFTAAQEAVTNAAAARELASDALTRKLLEVERQRRRLAGDHTPAEIGALTEGLRRLLIEVRHLRYALLEREGEMALAEASLEPAGAAAAQARHRLRETEAAFAAETANAARRDGWLAQLGEEPAGSLKTRAQAVVAAADPVDPFPAAQQRIITDLPAALLTRARGRAGDELQRAGAAADARRQAEHFLLQLRKSELGPEVELEVAWASFAEVESLLSGVVLRGQDHFDQALGLLAGIAASRPLTAAEEAAISAAELDGGADAALLEAARDGKATDLAKKMADLEAKKLELRAANVDANVDADPAVVLLQSEADDLKDELATVEGLFTPADREALDAWEAAVPDFAWSNLAAFERASELLLGLTTLDYPSLGTALENREDQLVTAVKNADKSRRTRETLLGRVADSRPAAEVAAAFLDRREAAALRGDRF